MGKLASNPDVIEQSAQPKASLLKILREKRKVSRTGLSRLTNLSTYQVEGLEGKGTHNILSRLLLCARAMGFKSTDIVGIWEGVCGMQEAGFIKGSLLNPIAETEYGMGIKSRSYLHTRANYLGVLELAVGKGVDMHRICAGDIIFGMVREGTAAVDISMQQTIHKKDGFFVIPGNLEAQISNPHTYVQASILLLAIKSPAENSV